jgi:hypothetical protein
MTQQVSLTDELTGKGIQTDHGGLTFTDLAVLLLDAVLFIYTAWRSYHFLSNSVPDDMQIMALVGLWGLDIGMIIWSLVWIFGSTEKYQDWIAMSFFLIDMTGVVLTSLTDSLMFSNPNNAMTEMLQGIAAPAIPLIVVANVVAGFIYHMTAPSTRARRDARRAAADYRRKMEEISKEQRDLAYAEGLLMAKQETLDKATILAEIRVTQAALEQATRAKLHDLVGIHHAAKNPAKAEDGGKNNALAQKLHSLKDSLARLGDDDLPFAKKHPDDPAWEDGTPRYHPNQQGTLANPTGVKTHLIQEGGDGSLALCGEQSPTQTTFLVTDATCPQCLAVHEKQMETVSPFSGNGGKPGNSASPS